MTVFGAGLLVGTALTVIIPEGIRALYSDVIEKMHSHKVIDKGAGVTVTPVSQEEDDVEHSSTIGLSLVLGEFLIFGHLLIVITLAYFRIYRPSLCFSNNIFCLCLQSASSCTSNSRYTL